MAGPAFMGASFAVKMKIFTRESKSGVMRRNLSMWGVFLIIGFFIIRIFIADHEILNASNGIVAFFAVRKYPFSIEFFLWNIGWLLILIAFCDFSCNKVNKKIDTQNPSSSKVSPEGETPTPQSTPPQTPPPPATKTIQWKAINMLETIGRTPCFYYCLHLWVLAILSLSVGLGEGTCLGIWSGWLVNTIVNPIILVPICRWFYEFRLKKGRQSCWAWW